jgi:hypothetical protein
MKQTVQPEASHAKKTAEPTSSRPAQRQAFASGGHLAQLAGMMNGSPRVQALAQMKEDIQGSARVQSLQQLSTAQLSESVRSSLAAGETAQFKIGIAGTLAHGDRVAGQDNAMEEHGSSAAESPWSSPCGCSSKQETAGANRQTRSKQEKPRAQKKSNGEERSASAQQKEDSALVPNRTGHSSQAHGLNSSDEFRNSSAPVQRLIVNVGDETLKAELAKPTGWIIASDIDVALQKGGEDQDIVELSELAGAQFEGEEDIYLVGHGAPGLLGSELPVRVARELNKIVPREYKGSITSLSCSAGVGETGKAKSSGVSRLATNLRNKKKSGVSVKGLSGIALNHPAYEGGGRAIKSEAIYEKYVEPEINKEIESVNEDWAAYVKKNGLADLKKAALMATTLSMQFYEKLERRVRRYLLPKEEDTTTVKS